MTQPYEVPYDDINAEIRPLVRLMNRMPGISTLSSCPGHGTGDSAYVAFVAESQQELYALLNALPRTGSRGLLTENRFEHRELWVTAAIQQGPLMPSRGLVYEVGDRPLYSLKIGGYPMYAQRRMLAEAEDALRAYLDPSPSR